MSDDDWGPEEKPREVGVLVAIAHDGNEDCAYNFGRECDCSAPAGLTERLRAAGVVIIPAGLVKNGGVTGG